MYLISNRSMMMYAAVLLWCSVIVHSQGNNTTNTTDMDMSGSGDIDEMNFTSIMFPPSSSPDVISPVTPTVITSTSSVMLPVTTSVSSTSTIATSTIASMPNTTTTTSTTTSTSTEASTSTTETTTSMMVTATTPTAGEPATDLFQNPAVLGGIAGGVVVIIVFIILLLLCCCCCCCRQSSRKEYNPRVFGVTARYWDHNNGTTHYSAGDGDSLSRTSSFLSHHSIRGSLRRWSRRNSKRASQRSGDFYTNNNAAAQSMFVTAL